MFAQLGVEGLAAAVLPFVAFLLGNMFGAFFLVDRLGRRPILVWGMIGMATTLLSAGLATAVMGDAAGGVAIACVIGYMSFFGASWGYGAWLYIPEIMPLAGRGKAVGLCTFINWGPANLSTAFLTPWMLRPSVLGAGGTLLFFGCVAVAFVPFAFLLLPETKGLPLETILPMFAFRGRAGMWRFIWGNITHGSGVSEGGGGQLAALDGAAERCDVAAQQDNAVVSRPQN